MYIKLAKTEAHREKQYLFTAIGHGANFVLLSCSYAGVVQISPSSCSIAEGKHLNRCHHLAAAVVHTCLHQLID